jgi:hypothetical protein
MKRLIFALATMATLGGAPARADTLLSADFQNGSSAGWVAMGQGEVGLSTYGTNVSLRIRSGGIALTALPTTGYRGLTVTLAFAAANLGEGGACVADASADGGQHWSEVYRLGAGQDDGVTLHAGGRALAEMADKVKVILRLRTVSASPAATCWADNVRVSARRMDDGGSGALAVLSAASLLDPHAASVPASMAAYAPPPHALPPTNRFEGRLVLGTERAGGGRRVLNDDFKNSGDDTWHHLPPFDFSFVQSGDALIPVQRGAIPSTHAMWEFILEPGRVWDEPGDGGYSRAALPFTLEERNANCMHNGVLTFLFRSDGSVSDVAYQIASETCRYFKFDLWGRAAARYVPQAVPDAARIASAYAAEVAARLPVKPIAALAQDHPGADPSAFGSVVEVDPADMTTYGLVLDGVNYRGGCDTRMGPYPFCEVMDLPSYSLAKSIFAGLAAMRLAKLYPGVISEMVAPLVPACAAAGSWNDVTLGNVLDMASGHYNSPADQADEDADDIGPFFDASDHAGRIGFACTHYPRKGAPGTQWVYHTADTYLLGTALNAFYRSKVGANADVFRDVLTPIWRQLALAPAIDVSRRSYDAVAQPFTGWGLTLHADDIAKLAAFITGPAPLLDRKMLDGALQRDPASTGMRASTADFRYHNGFWAWNAATVLGCKTPAWIPFMSGYGGIAVVLMPNGMTYYYFSDGGAYSWARAAAESDRIKPFCQRRARPAP